MFMLGLDCAIQLGFFVYSHAKLKMLEFYYDVVDRFIDQNGHSRPRFTGPRYTGTPIYREDKFPPMLEINGIYPDIPGTPIYRAKSFPPKIPVNRGPTVVLLK
eukprot:sb/3478229/